MATRDAACIAPGFGTGNGREKMENGKTGIWGKRRENGTGYGAIFLFSRPLPIFLQTSVALHEIT
jgi:hypothetical protein